MTLREEQEKVRKAAVHSLSHLQEDPWLAQRVLAEGKGEEPVKRKISLALVLAIVLGLAVMGTACALFSSQTAAFFEKHWNQELGRWLEGGKAAQIGESITVGGVELTLDEVVYRNRVLYGVGTARVQDEKDVLLPMDLAYGLEFEEEYQSEEAQALIQKAQGAGGRLLTVECIPERIGVDEGAMMQVGDTGVYDLRNEDGSLTFSFETGGYALEDGNTYQLELFIGVNEWTAEGSCEEDQNAYQMWTVGFEPVVISGEKEEPAADTVSKEEMQLLGYELAVPEEYEETGTLPVYQAIENDFGSVLDPEWFNGSGVFEKGTHTVSFNDHAELQYAPEGIWYAEYTEELFDYSWRERETTNPDAEPEMRPRQALSMGIADIASGVYYDLEDDTQEIALEHEQLTLLSLEEAKRTAEELLNHLGLENFELAWALDMSLERIETLGEMHNRFWYEGEGYSNAPKQDYASAAAEDEGYYLVYTPMGLTGISEGRYQMSLFVNGRGIANASIRSDYRRGENLYTPDTLIAPEKAIACLYEEMSRSLQKAEIASIERVALTYAAVRAENRQDGMVFVPAWQILYREADAEYGSWAEINAVNGQMIHAMFR